MVRHVDDDIESDENDENVRKNKKKKKKSKKKQNQSDDAPGKFVLLKPSEEPYGTTSTKETSDHEANGATLDMDALSVSR